MNEKGNGRSIRDNVPGKASTITLGAPFAILPLPMALSALRKGLVHFVKRSARILALLGFRTETLSRSPIVVRGGVNTVFHSDSSGKGGRADKGVSFELEVEVE